MNYKEINLKFIDEISKDAKIDDFISIIRILKLRINSKSTYNFLCLLKTNEPSVVFSACYKFAEDYPTYADLKSAGLRKIFLRCLLNSTYISTKDIKECTIDEKQAVGDLEDSISKEELEYELQDFGEGI